MMYCTESKKGEVATIGWIEKGVRQQLKVKVPFTIRTITKLIPKLKPIPDCTWLDLIFTLWDEVVDSTGYNPRVEFPVSFASSPFTPEWFYTPYDPAYYDWNEDDDGSVIVNGERLNTTYRSALTITYFDTPRWLFEDGECTGEAVTRRLFGGPMGNELDNRLHRQKPSYIQDGTRGRDRWTFVGEYVGGITSVKDLRGEEYVEKVDEFCVLIVRDENNNIVFERKIEGGCSSIEIKCPGDCPPGSCKCWISRAAGTFCCAKCRGK